VTIQQLQDAGIDGSVVGRLDGSAVLDRHELTHFTDFGPGISCNLWGKLSTLLMRKAMRIADFPTRPQELTSKPVRNLRAFAKRTPAECPLAPGLHIARMSGSGDSEYIYWFGMVLGGQLAVFSGYRVCRPPTPTPPSLLDPCMFRLAICKAT
jgi:hypothetical protein